MELEHVVISAFITIFSLGLLIVSLASYRKHRNQKLLFVSLVFFVLFFKGLVISVDVFGEGVFGFQFDPVLGVFDLVVVLLLYIAILKR